MNKNIISETESRRWKPKHRLIKPKTAYSVCKIRDYSPINMESDIPKHWFLVQAASVKSVYIQNLAKQ